MATDKDSDMVAQGAFPVDRPIEALLRDHDLVRKLADAYLNSESQEVKKQSAIQIMQALQNHSRLEESVFYPAVRDIDPAMIGRFEQDHQEVDNLLATLGGMSPDDPQCEQLVRELIGAVTTHIQQEESDLFPQLQQSGMDMTEVGLQMQAFEANLVHMQGQQSDMGIQRR